MFDHLFRSSSRSAVQFVLNIEKFYEQVSRTPAGNSFVSGFKKNLKSFSLEDFSELPDLVPATLSSPQARPQDFLKHIIQEFKPYCKECENIQLVKTSASDFKDLEIFSSDKRSKVVEIVWDTAPSAGAVIDLIENIEKKCPLELRGLITAKGFFYSTHMKSKSNWKSFEDGRLHSWSGLAANLISSFSYPVVLYLTAGTAQAKIGDFSKLREFARLQDSVFSLKIREEKIADKENSTPAKGKIERSISDTLRCRYKSCQPGSSEPKKDLGYYEKYIKESIVSKYSGTQDLNKSSLSIKSDLPGSSFSKTNPVFSEAQEVTSYMFKVVDSNKDLMPEIKMFCHKKNKSTDFQSKNPPVSKSTCSNTSFSTQEPWDCPKCSQTNKENSYECKGCRFISWDKFYIIKSKTLSRSGSSSIKPGDSRRVVDNSEYRYSFNSGYNKTSYQDKLKNSSSLSKYY